MPRIPCHFSGWLALALVSLPAATNAQPAAAVSAPAASAAPPAPWRSAFEGYRPFIDAPVTPWRESNDAVARIGGWRVYAREAAPPAAAAEPRSPGGIAPAPAAPVSPGHSH